MPAATDNSLLETIRRRNDRSAALALGQADELLAPSPAERVKKMDIRSEEEKFNRPLSTAEASAARVYLRDLGRMTGAVLSPGELDDRLNMMTAGQLARVAEDWKNLTNNKNEQVRLRLGSPKPLDIGEIIAREEQGAGGLLGREAVDPTTGKHQPVEAFRVKVAAAARLGRTYPDKFPATAGLLNDMRKIYGLAKPGENADLLIVQRAKQLMADPKAQERWRQDPYAQQLLTSLVQAEPMIAGSAASGGRSTIGRIIGGAIGAGVGAFGGPLGAVAGAGAGAAIAGRFGHPAVPPQRLPLEY